MLYSTATICAMRYPKKGKQCIYQKIILSRPRDTQFSFLLVNIIYPFVFFMIALQCLAYLKYIIFLSKPSIYVHFNYIGLDFFYVMTPKWPLWLDTFLTRLCLCDSYFACLMADFSVLTTSTIFKGVLNDTNMVTCRATYI